MPTILRHTKNGWRLIFSQTMSGQVRWGHGCRPSSGRQEEHGFDDFTDREEHLLYVERHVSWKYPLLKHTSSCVKCEEIISNHEY